MSHLAFGVIYLCWKNVKYLWCFNMLIDLTGICPHLELGACASNINRQMIDQCRREVDTDHYLTNTQIGWHDDYTSTPLATSAARDGHCYSCYFCQGSCGTLRALNQHRSTQVTTALSIGRYPLLCEHDDCATRWNSWECHRY